jgi:hypothetical protein
MKSLTRAKTKPTAPSKDKKSTRPPSRVSSEAQCCAKISRTTAGCHD